MKKQHLPFLLFAVLAGVMAAATVVEKFLGTPLVMRHVYGSASFALLWAVAAGAGTWLVVSRRMWRQPATFLLHAALLVILLGGAATRLTGQRGTMHLRQGEPPVDTFVTDGGGEARMPFALALEQFQLQYYTGSTAPMDFVSTLSVSDGGTLQPGTVSMNRVFKHRHYRFYQSAYDGDGRGTTLAVSHDPWGIGITYAGYALLLAAMGAFFFQRGSTFRRLWHHPALRGGASALFILLGTNALHASDTPPRTLPREVAAQAGELYIYYNDRICPLQTLARDFTLKLCGRPTYRGLTAEQVFTGWFFYYDQWRDEPMIKLKGAEIRAALGVEGRTARLADFFTPTGYKLDAAACTDGQTLPLRQVEEANEKANLASMAAAGSLWRIYPHRDAEGRVSWYSLADRLPADMTEDEWLFIRQSMNYVAEQVAARQWDEVSTILSKIKTYQRRVAEDVLPADLRFEAEWAYNGWHHTRPLGMSCAAVGLMAWGLYVWSLVRPGREERMRSRMWSALAWLLGAVGVYLGTVIAMRGYVEGHVPLSNGFETMQFMAWCCVPLALILRRRWPLALPLGWLVCGLALLVAMLGESNPPITQLMPVLASPLLSVHVAVIMLAYVLLAFVMLNGVTALALHLSRPDAGAEVERMQVVSRLMLYPAVFLLAAGIFVGAVWANVSWGRYWGWDPKEVWALITLLVYAAPLHAGSMACFRRPVFFHGYCAVAFLAVLVTYFGVNFLLGGLHGYA